MAPFRPGWAISCGPSTCSPSPPHVFTPRPKIDSAIVRFSPRPDPALDEREDLSRLLRILFQQRRKQLGTILRDRWTDAVERWCVEAGVDRRVRPEELSPDMLRALSPLVGSGKIGRRDPESART